jgi:hypothetical protein
MNSLREAARSPQRLFLYSGLALTLAVYQNPHWGNISRMGLLLILLALTFSAQAIDRVSGAVPGDSVAPGRQRILWVFWALLAVAFLVLAITLLRTLPGDIIDVQLFEADAARALLRGVNPYAITHADIYGPAYRFYAAHTVIGGRVQVGFPYPPLALYYVIPGYLLGDVRYAPLAAILLSAILILATRPHWQTLGIACLLLVNPLTAWVITRSWTEPLVLCTLCWVLYLATRRSRWLPLALGLFLASKQYTLLALPFVPFLLPQGRWKDYLRLGSQAVAVALALSAPFALWNPRRFWADVVLFPMHVPHRPDALSFAADKPIPIAWILLAVGLAVLFSLARSPRHPAMFAGCFGFTLLIFFCLNKGAFANYYFLISSTFWLAAAALPVPIAADAPRGKAAFAS